MQDHLQVSVNCHSLPAADMADACADKRTFRKKPPGAGGERSFVQFVLEPLYKIYAQVSRAHQPCKAPAEAVELLTLGGCMQAAEQHFAHMEAMLCSAQCVQLVSRHWQAAFLNELQCNFSASSKQKVFDSQVLTSLDAARLLSMLAADHVRELLKPA